METAEDPAEEREQKYLHKFEKIRKTHVFASDRFALTCSRQ